MILRIEIFSDKKRKTNVYLRIIVTMIIDNAVVVVVAVEHNVVEDQVASSLKKNKNKRMV